jgi:RNA polymerase sigma-70 factor (ECF subfamily)
LGRISETNHVDMDLAEFESILRAAQAGSEWAWSRLYAWLAADVRGYVRAKGARSPDDVLGEVFVQLARNIGTFDGDTTGFRSWAFMVAHHRVIDERRRRGSDRSIATEPAALPEESSRLPVDAEVLTAMSADEIRAWLGRHLTEEQRTIVLLRVFAGLSVAEIGEALGKRPGAVRVAHHRALAKLRAAAVEEGVTA